MKCILYICLILTSLLSSCTRYLLPSAVGGDIGYKPRPMVADSVRSMVTVNGGYYGTAEYGTELSMDRAVVNITRGHTFREWNFAYGIGGYYGSANRSLHPEKPDPRRTLPKGYPKEIAGLGLHSSIGLHGTSQNGMTDFRFINLENSVSRDFGGYNDFRRSLYGNDFYQGLRVSNLRTVWTTGLSSEIIFHHRRNRDYQHAFKLFVGYSPGLRGSFDDRMKDADRESWRRTNLQFNYMFQFGRINLVYMADFGVLSTGATLGYRF